MAEKSNALWGDDEVRRKRTQGIKSSYSDALRQKRREAALAQWRNPEKREQMVEKIRAAQELKPSRSGIPLGPRSPMAKLRKALEERAGNCCEVCGLTSEEQMEKLGRRLALHHLTYDKTIPKLEDVILVCHTCHGSIHGDGNQADRLMTVANAVGKLLKALGVDLEDENFLETPRRMTAYLLEHFLSSDAFELAVEECGAAVFPTEYDGMVVEPGISSYGICPHHLLPVIYETTIAYLPEGSGIGVSKLARVADLCLSLPILQEEATMLLSKTLSEMLKTADVAVFVEGEHLCMQARGIRAHGSSVRTNSVSGKFRESGDARAEVLSMIERKH